ncbi:MAG: hypothetical protein AB1445_01820 [Bacillota bacterium]
MFFINAPPNPVVTLPLPGDPGHGLQERAVEGEPFAVSLYYHLDAPVPLQHPQVFQEGLADEEVFPLNSHPVVVFRRHAPGKLRQ